jgi:glucose/arabinose dehydrogenase
VRIVERAGWKLEDAAFLDISDKVSGGDEQGLLGLAFHPKFAHNGRLFINYTDTDGNTRIHELHAAPGASKVDDTDKELLEVDQPYANHNGGNLVFGPDGKLYIGLGDGGSAGDPHKNGQNRRSLLGKMLRLDVDAAAPRPQIAAIGLRNPWRYSFDRKTGDLYIADVGQDKWEEVDVAAAGKLTGLNFGWNKMEGMHCFGAETCSKTGLTLPVLEYDHKTGCSITGGYVYRGKELPALAGLYFYSDYCTGILRSFRWKAGQATEPMDWKPALDPGSKLATISAFGQDNEGELYLTSLDGVLYRLSASP